MNFRDKKIFDFSNRSVNKPTILIGENGSGKTSTIKNNVTTYSGTDSRYYFDESHPSISSILANYLTKNLIIDMMQFTNASSDDLRHINKLTGKNYKELSFTRYSVSSLEEYGLEEVKTSILNELLIFDETIKDNVYYFFKAKPISEIVYDSSTMGIGEHHLLSFFFSLYHVENTSFFIDEPCNYLSVNSVKNFAKLLIYSLNSKNNLFTLTTNNLELIDYFTFFRQEMNIFHVQDRDNKVPINFSEFWNYYSSRYTLYSHIASEIPTYYVEDDLASKLINYLDPRSNVIALNGSGDLQTISKFIDLSLKVENAYLKKSVSKAIVIFDGDQLKTYEKSLSKMRFVRFLPFDDIEKLIVDYVSNNDLDFHDFLTKNACMHKYHIQKSLIMQSEHHDGYKMFITKCDISEDTLIKYIATRFQEELTKVLTY